MPPTSSSSSASDPPFVGRAADLERLLDLADDAAGGHGHVALLAGDPGIGKTRLAHEFERALEVDGRDTVTLWGRCRDGTETPPYWPWVEILRTHLDSLGLVELEAVLDVDAVEVARLVPLVRERLPRLAEPGRTVADFGQFLLFDAVDNLLRRAAERSRLVLVIEDLHWADIGTLELLRHLAWSIESRPLLIVGTYRDIEVVDDSPCGRRNLGHCGAVRVTRDRLIGLAESDVRAYLGAIEDEIEASPEALVDRTGGNPLFLREVVATITATGTFDDLPHRSGR